MFTAFHIYDKKQSQHATLTEAQASPINPVAILGNGQAWVRSGVAQDGPGYYPWSETTVSFVEDWLNRERIPIPTPTPAEIDDIFALLDAPAIPDASANYNAIEDVQFEALGELSALRAEAEAAIREHLQSGGLLADDTQTVSRLIRGRASMAMRAFPA